ncbi:hypothetical protein IKQ19_09880 [Candidatus Saccharibacteria bacterium]|nr:hypothetical protein [Candidatus Saccharibacteria bacterium]
MKILKILLTIILWIVEYFIIFGIGALPFGKPLMEVSIIVFFVAFIIFIVLCVLTWRLVFKKKKEE